MTRKDSVRHAATTTKDSVRHAAEVVAPYADSAKDTAAQYATHYAEEARRLIVPKVSAAADQAMDAAAAQYDALLAPRLAQARDAVPPKVVASTAAAAQRTRRAARKAARYTAPRVEQAVESARAAAEPVRDEAVARAGAAFAALRGQVTAAEVEKLVKRHQRRGRAGRVTKRVLVFGAIAGAGFAAYRWWSRQANPDWLVEAPSATETAEDERAAPGSVASPSRTTLGSVVDGHDGLDPEVRAKQDGDGATDRRRNNGRRGGGSDT
ncbi:DUF5324 family protein [Streptomyces sp. SL13]|uniref:DUF5324 family protein n=1 Tax=Streptantibioticus silvisoli TaxID=2705255 RepID=A0AA90KGH2_9ACTN|nr:DUF5324 family protein [Streptantibioticus silvisoli]MDI5964323.1 DUF5324 family protein [Streptantibioticus silvisoli]MDI5970575.1 DUF5324 family protein [Streptantibioticus silvisoli]